MAIQSSPFGPTILTGEDAKAFQEQIKKPPAAAAIELMRRGQQMAREFEQTGRVAIKTGYDLVPR